MELISYRYIRANRGRNRGRLIGCIAVRRSTGEIGWSYCSPSSPDQFRKETARKIAFDRLGVYDEEIGVEGHQKKMPDRVKREIQLTREWLNSRNTTV